MAGRYLGIEPIKLKNGRIVKNSEIVQEMSDKEAENRVGFEPENKTVKSKATQGKKDE